jgi:hypothetical protein
MKRLALAILFMLIATTSVAAPEWVGTVTLTAATDNVLSAAVALPSNGKQLAIVIPTITTGTVSLKVSHDGTTYQDLYIGVGITAPLKWATASGSGAITVVVNGVDIGAFTYLKVATGAEQAANRTFTLIVK